MQSSISSLVLVFITIFHYATAAYSCFSGDDLSSCDEGTHTDCNGDAPNGPSYICNCVFAAGFYYAQCASSSDSSCTSNVFTSSNQAISPIWLDSYCCDSDLCNTHGVLTTAETTTTAITTTVETTTTATTADTTTVGITTVDTTTVGTTSTGTATVGTTSTGTATAGTTSTGTATVGTTSTGTATVGTTSVGTATVGTISVGTNTAGTTTASTFSPATAESTSTGQATAAPQPQTANDATDAVVTTSSALSAYNHKGLSFAYCVIGNFLSVLLIENKHR